MDASNEIWDNQYYYLDNLLAAVTGMRQGEIISLQSKDIWKDHVRVEKAWDKKYGLKQTKTRDIRDIPIPTYIQDLLSQIAISNPDGFIFSFDKERDSPFTSDSLKRALTRSLMKIGISKEQISERGITFHSWRHFFNLFGFNSSQLCCVF